MIKNGPSQVADPFRHVQHVHFQRKILVAIFVVSNDNQDDIYGPLFYIRHLCFAFRFEPGERQSINNTFVKDASYYRRSMYEA